ADSEVAVDIDLDGAAHAARRGVARVDRRARHRHVAGDVDLDRTGRVVGRAGDVVGLDDRARVHGQVQPGRAVDVQGDAGVGGVDVRRAVKSDGMVEVV